MVEEYQETEAGYGSEAPLAAREGDRRPGEVRLAELSPERPLDTWAQIRSLAEQLGPSFGPMVVLAAATPLHPSELFTLEQGDVDRAAGVVKRWAADWLPKRPPLHTPSISRARESMPSRKAPERRGLGTIL